MKYLSLIFAATIFMACSLASAAPTVAPVTPTSTSAPPAAVNEVLSINPIVRTAEDGRLVLEPGANVSVRWDGLPTGSSATFILSNTLVDGGVSQIGQGTQASFTVPERIEGEISATAQLANGTTVNAITVPVVTENMISGDCQYIPPALGPGVSLYSEADTNSSIVGDVVYDGVYVVLATADGVDSEGATLTFYQIQHVDTGTTGFVPSNVGENLAGECSVFE